MFKIFEKNNYAKKVENFLNKHPDLKKKGSIPIYDLVNTSFR